MDTEIVAENLTSAGVKGGVVMYHGGMDASARSRAQSKVCQRSEMMFALAFSPHPLIFYSSL